MLKSMLVFAHLLAFAFAFGPIARSDWMMWQSRQKPLSADQIHQLASTARDASWALAMLWVSGIGLLLSGYASEGIHYLMNEKLWCKGIVVTIMTINGFALHRQVFPWLHAGTAFAGLKRKQRSTALALGAVSGTSWVFASYLGVARFMNYTTPFSDVFMAYLLIVAAGIAVAFLSQGGDSRDMTVTTQGHIPEIQ